MYHISIIAVGKCKESYLREACQEYMTRLTPFCRFELVEIEEYKLPSTPSQSQIEKGIEEEGARISAKIPANAKVVAMCIEGKMMSSEKLSAFLMDAGAMGSGRISFIIGGSFGLSQKIKARADLCLSVSPMTFPHQLFRVMLLEQLYRAFQIASDGKYHK